VAAVNGPENFTLSGQADALDAVLALLERDGARVQRLSVSHAMHSSLIEPMLDDFERRARSVTYSAPQIALVSNLTGSAFAPGAVPDASYWRSHLRQPVNFAGGIAAMVAAGCRVFVEAGAQPTLIGLGRRCVAQQDLAWLPSLKRGTPDHSILLHSLGEAYARGVAIDWQSYDAHRSRSVVSVPTYPFQRSRHWWEDDTGPIRAVRSATSQPASSSNGAHPLAGQLLDTAHPTMQTRIDPARLGYLRDHQVQGSTVLPATAYI
jgi:acyl transferase domain-containing protein